MGIRLGGFGLSGHVNEMKKAGFDFAELDMPELEAMSEEKFDTFNQYVQNAEFPVEIAGRILPVGQSMIFEDRFSAEVWREYLNRSCKRAAELGVKKVIFGNGKARSKPEGKQVDESVFFDFIRMICSIAGTYGLEVLLEPLGPWYSNYINRAGEAAQLARTLADNLFIMVDLRHMVHSKDDYESILENIDVIHHVHIDYPLTFPARLFPDISDDFDYGPFFDALKRAKYSGTITVEADIPEDWEAAYRKSRAVLGKYGIC